MSKRPVAALAMSPDLPGRLFDSAARARLAELVELRESVLTEFGSATSRQLWDVEVLITGWGAPALVANVLNAATQLRAIIHTAGSVKHILHPSCWDRGIQVTNAAAANATSVAEYTLAMIILAGKDTFARARDYHVIRPQDHSDAIGNYGRPVGIVGASQVGRKVMELLRPLDFTVLLSDPYVGADDARRLGATLVGLDEMVPAVSILSLHAPSTPQTRHLIDRRRLALLPDGASLINTARGALIDEIVLIDELSTGRINAILDVTEPEPPAPDSPLRTLPNVILTPHVAGSIGNEIKRLGDAALDELARYVAGIPFTNPVQAESLATMA